MGRKKVETVGRHIRLPKELDKFLTREAKTEGATNPQPVIRRVLTQYMQQALKRAA